MHRTDEHKPDGLLKHGELSYDKPWTEIDRGDIKNNTTRGPAPQKNVLDFTSAVTTSTLVAKSSSSVGAASRIAGTLFENAAPYSATGEIELHIISKELIHLPLVEPKLEIFADY